MPDRETLLKNFYGSNFNKEFAVEISPTEFKRIPIKNPEILYKLFNAYQKREKSIYISVYDYNKNYIIPHRKPKPFYVYPYSENVILDRVFLDFDKDLTSEQQKRLDNGLPSEKTRKYKEYIINGQAQEPIQEAKTIYKYIVDNFQGEPSLIFSGAKGCHLYIYFEPIKLQYPKETIKHFINVIEEKLNLKYLDPQVKGDFARVGRIPTSKHPKTGLYAQPWKYDFSYNEIVENAQQQKPPFDNIQQVRSNIAPLLYEIDQHIHRKKELIYYKTKLNKPKRKPTHTHQNTIKINDPSDILQLNQFPCFQHLPYTHDSRLIIANICLWMGLSPEETITALKLFAEEKGYYNPDKHLHNVQQVKGLKKYVFTCNTMKTKGLCNNKNGFCGNWFYLKLDLPHEYREFIEKYKKQAVNTP